MNSLENPNEKMTWNLEYQTLIDSTKAGSLKPETWKLAQDKLDLNKVHIVTQDMNGITPGAKYAFLYRNGKETSLLQARESNQHWNWLCTGVPMWPTDCGPFSFLVKNWSHFSNQPVCTYPYWWCWRGGGHRQEPSNCWTWNKRRWGHCGSTRTQWQCGVSSLTTSIATTHGNTWSWEAITCWTNQVYAWNIGRQSDIIK